MTAPTSISAIGSPPHAPCPNGQEKALSHPPPTPVNSAKDEGDGGPGLALSALPHEDASMLTDPRIGTELAGYRIDSVIGRGGMGVVYLAAHLRLKRKVALKLIAPELAEDPKFRERFLRESELAASLEHPNILPIYDAGEVDGQLY